MSIWLRGFFALRGSKSVETADCVKTDDHRNYSAFAIFKGLAALQVSSLIRAEMDVKFFRDDLIYAEMRD